MKKYCFLVGSLLFFWSVQSIAQPKLRLIPQHDAVAAARIEDDTIRLQLPFFEDFSQSKNGQSDPKKWISNTGAFINNHFAQNAPSYNFATFDGIKNTGEPYNFISPTASGIADVLTSQRLDLSGGSSADKIFMSFYWQAQGLGEQPDPDEDFLELQFKDNLGEWRTVWKQNGTQSTDFQYVIFKVENTDFFHKNFQFRFQSHNRLSGLYDVWNVDYIYIHRNRAESERFILDIAASQQPQSYLKRYQAMPIKQFFANEKNETTDTIRSVANNLFDQFNVISYDVLLKDLVKGDSLGLLQDTIDIIEGREKFKLFGLPLDTLPKGRQKMILEYTFRLNTGTNNQKDLDLKINDTIRQQTILDNFYAYDDGSAEYGVSLSQKFGKLAYRFELNVADILSEIAIGFVPLGINLNGETFNLYIWKKISSDLTKQKDSLLLIQNVPLEYIQKPNALTRIKLNKNIPLDGEFFVGIEQLTEKDLTLGFDRNNDSGQEIFYNVANRWEKNQKLKGSLLLRPIFAANQVTAIEKEQKFLDVKVYPNPTNGQLRIDGKIKKARIFDLNGQLILEKSFDLYENKELFLDQKSGIYFLHLEGNTLFSVQKIVLVR